MISSTLLVALAGLSTFSQAAPTLSKRGSSKLGYAFGKGAQAKIEQFSPNQGCWGYDWEARVNDSPSWTLPSNCEFVPMLHDGGDMFVNAWKSGDAQGAIDAGAKHILSFNEPDHCGPSHEGGTCMDVATAVAKHKELVQPYADKGIKIGSPAVTNGQEAGKGLNYLKDFLNQCDGCQIDFVCAHWQWAGATDVKSFTDHIETVHRETGKPVWVTEYQAPSGNDPVQFMKEATEWMDKQDFVQRYAYWSVDAKLTNGNALSDLGAAYAGL